VLLGDGGAGVGDGDHPDPKRAELRQQLQVHVTPASRSGARAGQAW
jgi:hypothetical protein